MNGGFEETGMSEMEIQRWFGLYLRASKSVEISAWCQNVLSFLQICTDLISIIQFSTGMPKNANPA